MAERACGSMVSIRDSEGEAMGDRSGRIRALAQAAVASGKGRDFCRPLTAKERVISKVSTGDLNLVVIQGKVS